MKEIAYEIFREKGGRATTTTFRPARRKSGSKGSLAICLLQWLARLTSSAVCSFLGKSSARVRTHFSPNSFPVSL